MRPLKAQSADLFREIVNVGASQSSAALAARVSRPVRITVPVLREVELAEAATILGPPEEPVQAGLCLFSGTFEGAVLLALPETEARRLGCALGVAEDDQALEPLLAEVLHAFVASAGMFLGAELTPFITRSLFDMAGCLVPSLLAELEYDVDLLWLVEVTFVPDEEASILGRLFFLADDAFRDLIDELAS